MNDRASDAQAELLGLTFFPQQWRAVTAPLGPVLVLAGPGAGKTRCLTGRIAFLLEHHRVDPTRICAITFTNKAAQEIHGRLRQHLADRVESMTLGTIHALFLAILRKQGRRVGLPAGFGIANEDLQKLILNRLGVHSSRHRQLLMLFSRHRLQRYSLTPNDLSLFERYQHDLRSNHLIDYDEVLALTHQLLQDDGPLRASYQGMWDHILVDEFQDLDPTQYASLKLLADQHRSLFAVGDDEQSIFAFRGADSRVIARFVTDFKIDEPIVLDRNCRCSEAIFRTARMILPPSEFLFRKRITADRPSRYPVRSLGLKDDYEEMRWLVEDLRRELAESGAKRGDFGILYRNNKIGQLLEEALVNAGIPCQLSKGQALVDDPVIAVLLAALQVILQPEDELPLEHLARKVFKDSLVDKVRSKPGPKLLDKFRSFAENRTDPDASRCWRFLYQVENFKGLRQAQRGLPDLVQSLLDQGIGQYEGALESRHGVLEDPDQVPDVRAIADGLLGVLARGGRVFLTPAHGLEIPARIMLERCLPPLLVGYLRPGDEPAQDDLVLALDGEATVGHAATVVVPARSDRLRITRLFKALQTIESREFRKFFTDYVVFDTETTGKDIASCEVIELAAVRVREGQVVDQFHALVRNTRPVPADATRIHGYTDADLAGQPSLAEVWPSFRAFVGDDVLVAHNGYFFDIPLLERLTAGWNGMKGLTYFDTLPLARNLYPTGAAGQEALADRLGVPTGRSHRALDDVLCLAQVFERLQEERLRRSRKTCLPHLLDCVALGAALEGPAAVGADDAALLEASTWHDLKRHAEVVDRYEEETAALGLAYPSLQTLLDRLRDPRRWPGARGETPARDRHPEAQARLARLMASVQATDLEDAIRELLDKLALSTSEGMGIDPDRVSLLTFHATKGLEFARVYLVGIEDNQIPGYYAMTERRRDEIQEARRLLYVAMTRARDRLTLTWAQERQGKPSGGTLLLDEMGLTKREMSPCGQS